MSEEATLDTFADKEGETTEDVLTEVEDEWQEISLENICEIGGGSTPKKGNSDYWEGGDILWASPKDFNRSRLTDTEDKLTEEGASQSTSKTYPPDTTLLVVRSGILRHTLPVAITEKSTTVNQDIKALEPDHDIVNPEYFFQAVSGLSEDIRGSCKKTGTTVESIQTSVLKQYSLPVPPKQEQEKIAGVLYNIDDLINQTKDVIRQSNQVKRGLLQDLFSLGYDSHEEWQEVDKQDAYLMSRADEVPAEWELRQSDEIAEIKTGHTPSTSVDEYWDGDISWIDIHDLTQLEKNVIETTDDTITEEGLENSGAKLLPEGTLVLCRTGAIGETAILGKEMATDQDQVTFECDENIVLPRYLMYLFEHATPQLERLSAGSTHDKVQLHFFSDLEIPLPSIDEQKKIADALESFDDVVISNKEQLENLKRLKKGLQQDLLSGEVRTVGKEIDIPDEVTYYEPE